MSQVSGSICENRVKGFLKKPFISIIIPARNEEQFIAKCLHSVLNTNYPRECMEIIIADGMSQDRTREEIEHVAAGTSVPIRIVDNPEHIVPTGLNRAIREAKGEIIIRLDAHAEYGEDYVRNCVEVLQQTNAHNVGGPIETVPRGDSIMARAIAAATAHPLGVGNSAFRTSREAGYVDTVPYGCFPRDVFLDLGLYDERFVRNQDYEMNQRIRRAGGRIYMDPRIVVRYFNQGTLRGLLNQAFKNGFWNSMMHYIHPNTRRARHLLPAFFSLGSVALCLALTFNRILPDSLFVKALLMLSGAGYATYGGIVSFVSIKLSIQNGIRQFPYLMTIFPSFHFSYGAGIIWGWICVAFRRLPWNEGIGIGQIGLEHQHISQSLEKAA